jgi:hypothetical protein
MCSSSPGRSRVGTAMSDRPTTMADAALDYAEHEVPIFPCLGIVDGRCACPKGADCKDAGKHPIGDVVPNGLKNATTDRARITAWWRRYPQAHIATTTSWCVVLDVDPRHGGDVVLAALERQHCPLPETAEVLTGGGGRHLYFLPVPGLRCSSGNVGAGLDIRADGGYVLLPPSGHVSGGVYRDEVLHPLFDTPLATLPTWLLALARHEPMNGPPAGGAAVTDTIPEGQRNARLASLAGTMRRRGMETPEIMVAMLEVNRRRCQPPLPESEVREIAASISRYAPAADRPGAPASAAPAGPAPEWPTLNPAALYGLPGQIVRTIAPHSEADPVAILLHTLVSFGALLGAGPHARVERDAHPARLNAVCVGKTGKGRKGLSWSTPRALVRAVDPTLAIASGLSTGEGLIYHVRDPHEETDPKTGERVVQDAGVADKRLLIMETEFATVLGRMTRDGNTLSAILRDTWDHGTLRTLVKNSPLHATGAHVAIMGHITHEELVRLFTDVSMANGFGNRFLWACVKRSQFLPDGAGLNDDALEPLIAASAAVQAGLGTVGRLTRDAEAAAIWTDGYAELSRERDGLVGALLGRAEAQALRLSVLYAVLDRSPVIRPAHLEAALAVWAYCEQSVLYLFGPRLGHPAADAILDALRRSGRLTRTQIRDLFARHKGAEQIEAALDTLARANLARRTVRETGGRPEEAWEPV